MRRKKIKSKKKKEKKEEVKIKIKQEKKGEDPIQKGKKKTKARGFIKQTLIGY